MSEDDTVAVEDTSDTRLLTAEYRDGQLQIVEVTPFDKNKETHIVPEQLDEDGKYTMVETDKGLMQLDLLNLTLVRCEDGEESYQLVAGEGSEMSTDGTVTCVLQSSDSDDHDNQQEYVMMENDQGSLVILQPSQSQAQAQTSMLSAQSEADTTASPKIDKKQTPAELLQKAKAMKKAKSILAQMQAPRVGRRGRKPRNDIPPPHELLASPNFKLYLYSCKLCNFKCNATKELTAHKCDGIVIITPWDVIPRNVIPGNVMPPPPELQPSPNVKLYLYSCKLCSYKCNATKELYSHKSRFHGPLARRTGRGAAGLQCARCPYKAITHLALENHMKSHPGCHDENIISDEPLTLDSVEVANADVLVCGACGFESGSRDEFRRHIALAHGVVTTSGS